MLVEDNPGDIRLIKEMLKEESFAFTLETCERLTKCMKLLSSNLYDAILLDLGLPDSQGLETFFAVNTLAARIPVIILTGQTEGTLGVEAVRKGAQDYLVKGKLTGALLIRAITYAVERKKFDETQRKQEQIRRQNVILGSIKRIFEEALSNRTEEELGELCLSVADEITQSKFAFIGQLNSSGLQDIAISNPGWDACTTVTQQGHRRPPGNFKIHGLYGKVLSEGKSFFTNEPSIHPERIGLPVGHPPLTAFLGVPLIEGGKVIGMVAVANRDAGYTHAEVEALEALASAITVAFSRKRAEAKLEQYNKDLEQLVEERTKQLRQSERLAAIGQTAGMVGHDIRNPLQAITGDVFLAKQDLSLLIEGETRQSLQENLESIEQNVEYINKIVADLQDYVKPLKPYIEETNLTSIVNNLLVKNRLPEKIKTNLNIEINAEKIMTDSAYIKRIIGNLVSNAVQAMPEGGKLSITARKESKNIIITVEDTGKGIVEDIKPRLFQPLITTKSQGQGFGLAVVKRLTEALGGTVSFDSEVGKGTKFIICLPTQA